MFEISKADWKLFRARLPEWQEKYMERLTKEYIELLSSSEPASTRFWELEKRIKEDRRHPGVILEMRKSTAAWNIATLVAGDVITLDDVQTSTATVLGAIKIFEN
jgi:hypothetical protein